MAIGSTNSSNNNKLEEDIKESQNNIKALQNPEFTEASSRSNISSKESIFTILGKIKKYLTDLKSHAFNEPKNNLTITSTGYALDAYQGKVLNDKLSFMFVIRDVTIAYDNTTYLETLVPIPSGYSYFIAVMTSNGWVSYKIIFIEHVEVTSDGNVKVVLGSSTPQTSSCKVRVIFIKDSLI